ncbi:14893_t:CDS:2, partial [Gigaspora margarita]
NAFNWLNLLLEKKEKIYSLLNENITKYIKDFPNENIINIHQEEKFFDEEIAKINDETCFSEKQFLYKLKEKFIEIENIEDFIEKTIKKNDIYKLIKDIFKESSDE